MIERGECRPIGSDTSKTVDVRVIATTRRDVQKEVAAGKLREDLYFRMAIGRVKLPPLRERHGDLELLAEHFATRMGAALPADLLSRHDGYRWPGNVRELQNVVTRWLALGETDLDASDEASEHEAAPQHAFRWALEQNLPFTAARDMVVAEFERAYIARVLDEHEGNVSRAAAASGLARRYFQILRARQRTSDFVKR